MPQCRVCALKGPVDSAERYAGEKGVDVFIGKGKFTGANTIEVNGKTLHFSKAVIATGGSPAIPNIPGIESVSNLTNATVFNLTELPKRLAVIGIGPIGLELAQPFMSFELRNLSYNCFTRLSRASLVLVACAPFGSKPWPARNASKTSLATTASSGGHLIDTSSRWLSSGSLQYSVVSS